MRLRNSRKNIKIKFLIRGFHLAFLKDQMVPAMYLRPQKDGSICWSVLS